MFKEEDWWVVKVGFGDHLVCLLEDEQVLWLGVQILAGKLELLDEFLGSNQK